MVEAAPTSNPTTSPITPIYRAPSGGWSISKLQQLVGLAIAVGGMFAGLVLTYDQVSKNTAAIARMEPVLTVTCLQSGGTPQQCVPKGSSHE